MGGMFTMPRRSRKLMDNGFYHTLTRGNDRKNIFRCEEDYLNFLTITFKYLMKYDVHIFHYCLMPNHIHFLVQASTALHLPKFMQGILQSYAWYFRKKYDSVGFVFQNRYKSLFIERESYLLECARYIERNPLRAKLTNNLFKYPWSSFSFYANGLHDVIIKHPNPGFLGLAGSQEERQRRFRDYVLEQRPYDQLLDETFRMQ
jgi:putative transposase